MFLKYLKIAKEIINRKNDLLRQYKIKFLYNQAFDFYFDMEELKEQKDNVIELPFAKEHTAHKKAMNAILYLISKGRIDECYSKRKKELRKLAGIK